MLTGPHFVVQNEDKRTRSTLVRCTRATKASSSLELSAERVARSPASHRYRADSRDRRDRLMGEGQVVIDVKSFRRCNPTLDHWGCISFEAPPLAAELTSTAPETTSLTAAGRPSGRHIRAAERNLVRTLSARDRRAAPPSSAVHPRLLASCQS